MARGDEKSPAPRTRKNSDGQVKKAQSSSTKVKSGVKAQKAVEVEAVVKPSRRRSSRPSVLSPEDLSAGSNVEMDASILTALVGEMPESGVQTVEQDVDVLDEQGRVESLADLVEGDGEAKPDSDIDLHTDDVPVEPAEEASVLLSHVLGDDEDEPEGEDEDGRPGSVADIIGAIEDPEVLVSDIEEVVPQQPDEFLCTSCWLVQHVSLRKAESTCRDCW